MAYLHKPMAPPQVTVPSSACAQRHRFAAAYSILEQAISSQAFPGAAFGVLLRGEVLQQKVRPWRSRANTDTEVVIELGDQQSDSE